MVHLEVCFPQAGEPEIESPDHAPESWVCNPALGDRHKAESLEFTGQTAQLVRAL